MRDRGRSVGVSLGMLDHSATVVPLPSAHVRTTSINQFCHGVAGSRRRARAMLDAIVAARTTNPPATDQTPHSSVETGTVRMPALTRCRAVTTDSGTSDP